MGPLGRQQQVEAAAAFRLRATDDPIDATKAAMRSLARRYSALQAEIANLDAALAVLVPQAAPEGFLERQGVGVISCGRTRQKHAISATVGDPQPARGSGIEPEPDSSKGCRATSYTTPDRNRSTIVPARRPAATLAPPMGSLIKKRRKRMRKKKHKKMLKATRWQRRAGK